MIELILMGLVSALIGYWAGRGYPLRKAKYEKTITIDVVDIVVSTSIAQYNKIIDLASKELGVPLPEFSEKEFVKILEEKTGQKIKKMV